VHVLNYDGNVTDAACVAAVAALIHFSRPDVTVSGEEVVIHSFTERLVTITRCQNSLSSPHRSVYFYCIILDIIFIRT